MAWRIRQVTFNLLDYASDIENFLKPDYRQNILRLRKKEALKQKA